MTPDRAAAATGAELPTSRRAVPTFEHHEVVHQLLHAGARLRRELLGRRIVHRRDGAVELVGAPRQRTGLAQQSRDRLRRWRLRPVRVVVGHATIVLCATSRSWLRAAIAVPRADPPAARQPGPLRLLGRAATRLVA